MHNFITVILFPPGYPYDFYCMCKGKDISLISTSSMQRIRSTMQFSKVWHKSTVYECVNVEWKASTWMISCMFVNPRQDLPVSLALLTGAYSLKSTALSVCTTGLCGFMIVWEYGKTCALLVCQPHIHQGFEVLVLWVSFHIGYSLYSLLMDQTGSSIATGAAATKWP